MKLPFPHNKQQREEYKKIQKQVSHHMSPSINILVVINIIFIIISLIMFYKLISLQFSVQNITIFILSIAITFLTYCKMIKQMSGEISADKNSHSGKKHKKGGKK